MQAGLPGLLVGAQALDDEHHRLRDDLDVGDQEDEDDQNQDGNDDNCCWHKRTTFRF